MTTRLTALMTGFTDGSIERVQRFIATLNTTNWLIVTGTLMAALTGAAYLTAMLMGTVPEPITFGGWLAFVTGWMSNGVRQFRIKRESHIPGGPQDAPKETPHADH